MQLVFNGVRLTVDQEAGLEVRMEGGEVRLAFENFSGRVTLAPEAAPDADSGAESGKRKREALSKSPVPQAVLTEHSAPGRKRVSLPAPPAPSPLPLALPAAESPCPRWAFSSVVLASGECLLFGGEDDEQRVLGDVWVLNPETLACSQPVHTAQDGRLWHSASLLADGHSVMMMGGETDGAAGREPVSDPSVLDTDIMLWYPPSVSGKPPAARSGHSATAVGERLVVFGGCRGRNWQNSVAVLCTRRWKWSHPKAVGEAPEPRSYHSATAVGDRFVVVFGGNNHDMCFNSVHQLALPEGEGGGTPTWFAPEVVGEAPRPRCGHSALLLPGSPLIAVAGGWDPQGPEEQVFGDVFLLHTEEWLWTRVEAALPRPRVGHASTSASGSLLVFGGRTEEGCVWDPVRVPLSLL